MVLLRLTPKKKNSLLMNYGYSQIISLLTYCFLNLSSTGREGEPIISWIFATWSSSFDPGNKGRRLHGEEERRGEGRKGGKRRVRGKGERRRG